MVKRSSYGTQWGPESVKALRQHLGLTQEQMAQQLGTRQQTISEWERGLYIPRGTSRTLLKMVAERAGFRYQVKSPRQGQGDPPERPNPGC
jgi:DNA-binding transcriptional regulator YiaG